MLKVGVWDLKGEEKQLTWRCGKANVLLNKCLRGQAETMGHREEFEHTKFARLLLSMHLVHIIVINGHAFSWNRSSICILLGSLGQGQRFILSLLWLDCFQLKIIQIPRRYFGVVSFAPEHS